MRKCEHTLQKGRKHWKRIKGKHYPDSKRQKSWCFALVDVLSLYKWVRTNELDTQTDDVSCGSPVLSRWSGSNLPVFPTIPRMARNCLTHFSYLQALKSLLSPLSLLLSQPNSRCEPFLVTWGKSNTPSSHVLAAANQSRIRLPGPSVSLALYLCLQAIISLLSSTDYLNKTH